MQHPGLAEQVRALLGPLSSRAAAARTGISHATIAAMERGARPSMDSILKFARGFDVDPNLLLAAAGYDPLPVPAAAVGVSAAGWPDDPLAGIGREVDVQALARVPLAPGAVSANIKRVKEPLDAPPQTLGDALPGQVRAIRVEGDCMEPFYQHGDVLLVRESDDAHNGDKVIALVDWDGITCKVLRQNGARYLEPTNGDGRIAGDRFRILGIVVGYFRRERR
jgi:SOS-response transcriptional repressor LexA